MTSAPYDFDQAREAAANATTLQKAAEDFIREAYKDAALKNEAYRKRLAEEIVRVHNAGSAWTVAQDLARGNDEVARMCRERDIAEGVKEAAVQAAWRRKDDTKFTERFIEWSMRRELAEGYGRGA